MAHRVTFPARRGMLAARRRFKMDHQKTGLFISALRREKGWTQKELAERLGVTDKAVSRWETGKGLPDVSLLRPLSEALGVTVNELLAGETVEPEQALEKSDAFVLRAMEETDERIWRFRRNALCVTGAVLLAGALIFLGFDTSLFFAYAAFGGALLLAAAAYITFRARLKKGLLAAAVVLLLIFGLLEARDYAYVKYYSLPPQLNLRIETGSGQIKYEKLFYDVYRINMDTGEEAYAISAKQKE